jgi:hypothetical protein
VSVAVVLATDGGKNTMRTVILALVGLLAVSGNAQAQSDVEAALSAAPTRARAAATVIEWNADQTYETLKEGTNHLVCYSRADERDRSAFDVQCTSLTNLGRVTQNRLFRSQTADRAEETAMIRAAEADGSRAEAEYASVWYARRGDDLASAGGVHTTVAVPGATPESTGFPTTREAGGIYLMQAGTGGAHLMLPGR